MLQADDLSRIEFDLKITWRTHYQTSNAYVTVGKIDKSSTIMTEGELGNRGLFTLTVVGVRINWLNDKHGDCIT